MNNPIYYINGDFVRAKDAVVPFNDGGFQRGNAIFETIRFSKKKLLYINEHIQRLRKGINYLEFNVTHSDEQLISIIKKIIDINSLDSGAINVIVSSSFDTINPFNSKANIYISIRQIKKINSSKVKVIFLNEWDFPIIRFKDSIKISSYAGNIKALKLAKKNKAFDAVFINKKTNITEATMRNIFFIKNKKVFTPPLSLGILPGTTRRLIFKLCKEHAYDCSEKIIKFEDINNMDEAFLTSSTYGIIPCYWDTWDSDYKYTEKLKNLLDFKLSKEL